MKTLRQTRASVKLAVVCGLALAAGTFTLSASQQSQVTVPPPQTGAGGADQGRGRANVQVAPLVATGVIVGRVIDAASGEPVASATVSLSGGPPRSAQSLPQLPPGAPRPAPQAPPPPPPRVLTDGQGRFAFRQLTRGNYTLSAEKSGYSGGAFGRSRPGGPSRTLQLDDNERMPDVSIRVFKLTAIAGRVVDEAGEPVVGVTVRTFRRMWVAGQRALSQSSQTQTDDRGMYRLHNLTPGEYIVSVPMTSTTSGVSAGTPEARQNLSMTQQGLTMPSPFLGGGVPVPADGRFFWQPGGVGSIVAGPDGRWRGYATQYYPMARESSQAETIVLASGEERTGVDFAMTYVPTSTIAGIIVGSSKPPSNWVLRLVPTSSGEFTDEFEVASAVSDGSGAFIFAGVPSGSYVIQTVRVPPPAPPPPPPPPAAGGRGGLPGAPVAVVPVLNQQQTTTEPLLWGITPINVGEQDVAGVGVNVREGLIISGRLEFSGSRPRPDATRMSQIPIVIEPVSGRDRYAFGPPSRTQPDGRFVSAPRLPGRYFVRVGGAPSGWIVQSIHANGADATERPIELTSQNISNVVITFTDLIGSIRGTLRNASPNADPPTAVMFPADPAGWKEFGVNPGRLRQMRAGPNGEFSFGSLSPGDYFVVGIKDEYSGEWQNPAYLESLARFAQRIALSAGEQRVIDITVQDVKPPGIGRTPAPVQFPSIQSIGEIPSMRSSWESPDGSSITSMRATAAITSMQGSMQLPARDTRTTEPTGTGSIAGRITDSEQKTPLRLARVSLRGGGLTGERLALTDAEGRYILRGLPAGDYQVSVNKPAFINMSYGARMAAPSAGATIKLAAGAALSNIDVALTRGGVIAGVVLDSNGQPAPLVQVQALTYTQRDGERWMTNAPAGSAQTDDRGMYRIYGLRPGKFFVLARPPGGSGNVDLRAQSDDEIRAAIAEATRGPVAVASPTPKTLASAPPDAGPNTFNVGGRPVALSPVMYPGVVREQDAGELSLGPAQELSGINFRLEHVAASRVSGVVIGPDGQPARNARVSLYRTLGASSTSVAVRSTPDGAFDSTGVPPGSYRLLAQVPVSAGGELRGNVAAVPTPGMTPIARDSLYFAMMELDLFGSDATNLTLTTVPPLTVSGRVVTTGPPGTAELRQVTVRLEPVGRPAPGVPAPAASNADPTGVFTITNVLPGRYRLTASGPSVAVNGQMTPSWTVVSSSAYNRDALVVPFDVTASITDASVTVSSQPSEILGKLIDGRGEPVPDLWVVLFPTDPTLWSMTGSRVMRNARSQTDGIYRFTGVLPREYFLAVLTELDLLEWGSQGYMEQLVQSSIKVTVGLGEKKTFDVKLSGR